MLSDTDFRRGVRYHSRRCLGTSKFSMACCWIASVSLVRGGKDGSLVKHCCMWKCLPVYQFTPPPTIWYNLAVKHCCGLCFDSGRLSGWWQKLRIIFGWSSSLLILACMATVASWVAFNQFEMCAFVWKLWIDDSFQTGLWDMCCTGGRKFGSWRPVCNLHDAADGCLNLTYILQTLRNAW